MAKESKTRERERLEITSEVLSGVIDLARLDPLAPGMSLQKDHLKKILEHFQVLSQVSLEGLDPTIQVNPSPLPFRSDEAIDGIARDEALSNARLRTSEFFRAPLILGGEETGES